MLVIERLSRYWVTFLFTTFVNGSFHCNRHLGLNTTLCDLCAYCIEFQNITSWTKPCRHIKSTDENLS